MNDAVDDSDDEVDYTKMDLGNKKVTQNLNSCAGSSIKGINSCDFTPNKQGPVGRWDFDNPEDYADYMSTKEALPKAAFQYGVKMAEGRKTGKKVRSPPKLLVVVQLVRSLR